MVSVIIFCLALISNVPISMSSRYRCGSLDRTYIDDGGCNNIVIHA